MASVISIFSLLFVIIGCVLAENCSPTAKCGSAINSVPGCGGPNQAIECLKKTYNDCHEYQMQFVNALITEKFLTKVVCENQDLREEFVKDANCWIDSVFHNDCFLPIALNDKYSVSSNRSKVCDAAKEHVESCKKMTTRREGCDDVQKKFMDASLKSMQCGAASIAVHVILLVFAILVSMSKYRD